MSSSPGLELLDSRWRANIAGFLGGGAALDRMNGGTVLRGVFAGNAAGDSGGGLAVAESSGVSIAGTLGGPAAGATMRDVHQRVNVQAVIDVYIRDTMH